MCQYCVYRVRGQKIEVQLRVRATEPDGMLLWTGEDTMSSSSDYLALGLKDGKVRFGFNLGSGEIIITYNDTRIDDGEWHKIKAHRYGKLLVNSSPASAAYMHQWTGSTLVQIMAWHLFGAKPLPEPRLTYC